MIIEMRVECKGRSLLQMITFCNTASIIGLSWSPSGRRAGECSARPVLLVSVGRARSASSTYSLLLVQEVSVGRLLKLHQRPRKSQAHTSAQMVHLVCAFRGHTRPTSSMWYTGGCGWTLLEWEKDVRKEGGPMALRERKLASHSHEIFNTLVRHLGFCIRTFPDRSVTQYTARIENRTGSSS